MIFTASTPPYLSVYTSPTATQFSSHILYTAALSCDKRVPRKKFNMSEHHDPIADAKAQEATHNFIFRDATTDDIPALQKMIEESLRGLGKGYYTQAELDGSIGYLFGPDTLLLHVSIKLPYFQDPAVIRQTHGCGYAYIFSLGK